MAKIIQTLDQKQKLNPRQILEANMMQLNCYVLEKRILEEVENNPILDITEDTQSDENDEEEDTEFNWDELISNPEDYNIPKKNNLNEFFLSNKKSLEDDFISQLNGLNISDNQITIAKLVLGNLNEAGYLTIEPILIADKLNIEESDVTKVINIIKTLDPPGIGSKDIQECLITQLKINYPKESIALDIITNYFDLFKKHNYSKIIDKNNCSKEELNQVLKIISILNPNPASNYSLDNTEHIYPDVIVEQIKGEWHVSSNNVNLPVLAVNLSYKKMIEDKKIDKKTKNYLKQKLESANWFINALSNRHKTITSIMGSIIKHQKSYFDSEKRELSPLILKTIAKDVNMDISTISRATNDKYVQLPWGCVELKIFFSEGISTKDGDIISNTVVKKEIQDLINDENKKYPLTDQELANNLSKKDYVIARRTITKYREMLKIPIARLRRKNI